MGRIYWKTAFQEEVLVLLIMQNSTQNVSEIMCS